MFACGTGVCFCCAPENGAHRSAPANAALPKYIRIFSFMNPSPRSRDPQYISLDCVFRESFAALRMCTTALMLATLQTVSADEPFCSNGQHACLPSQKCQTTPRTIQPSSPKKVSHR